MYTNVCPDVGQEQSIWQLPHGETCIRAILLGNVDEGITKPAICKDFKNCNVYAKEACKKCFARFYCSGGCAANSYNFKGKIDDVYEVGCELERKRVECAIMIKAAMAEEEV